MSSTARSSRFCTIAAPLAAMAVGLAAMMLVAAAPPASGQVALVLGPRATLEGVAAALGTVGGRLVRPGRGEFVVVADFPGPIDWDSLHDAGVLLGLDPQFAGGCLTIARATGIMPAAHPNG